MEMKKYRLADIAEIVISSVDKKTKPGEKIVRLCNFTDVYHNWAIKQSDYDSFMVASASDSNINKLSLKKGFVAFTKDSETRDDIGISTYIADDFEDVVLGYHCALAKPNEKIVYGKYLNAFMSSDYIKKYFELNATGSGMRFTLAVSTMEDMPIMLPSLNVQKKVGDMLSDFDKRIENLRAQNRVLEQTAKTIYDYTFLQCAGHQTTYNKTLNRNIPVGWEVKNIFDVFDIKYGFPFSTELFTEEITDKPVVRIRDILEHTTSAYTTEIVDEKYRLQEGDLVIGMDGNFHMNLWTDNISYLNQRCVRIRMNDNNVTSFQAKFALAPYIKAKEMTAKGSTVGHLSDKDLKGMFILVPDSKTLKNFNAQVLPIFQKQLVNTKQIEALTTQRNTLLPLLMNGQVEV